MTAKKQVITDLIDEHAVVTPDGRAFVCEDHTATWSKFAERVDRVASALAGLQIGLGDKVAILAHSSILYVESFFGAIKAGACVVPLPITSSPAALRSMLQDSDAKALFLDRNQRILIASFEREIVDRMGRNLVALDFSDEGWTFYEDLLDRAPRKGPSVALRDSDHFNIIYSSGTTGEPKGILHDHGMRYRQAVRSNYGYTRNSVNLLSTPMYSNATLQPMLATVAHGGTTILMGKFDVLNYLTIAEGEKVTHTMLVPVQYQRILTYPDFKNFDLTAFQVKQSTGAPFSASLKKRVLNEWPGRMVEVYGMTEGGCTCLLEVAKHPDKLASVGRPAPDNDVRIINDQDLVVPKGEVGEVIGHSPFMMVGYYGQPEKTEDYYWRDGDGKIFHRSGDIGRFDEDGFLILLDRKKDMIISGGHNIYASDLEDVLLSHPDVADAAVIGVPHERWGETPLALVVCKPESLLDTGILLDWVNARLGKIQRLSAVEFRRKLPRSNLGKLLKRDLREDYKVQQ